MGRASRFGAPSTVVATRVGPRTTELIDRERGTLSRARFLDLIIARHFGLEQTEDGTAVPDAIPTVPPRADGKLRLGPPGIAPEEPADHVHEGGRPAVSRSLPGGGMITRYYCVRYPDCVWTTDWQ